MSFEPLSSQKRNGTRVEDKKEEFYQEGHKEQ